MTLLNNILPEQRRGKLKALLETGKIVRVLEAHNGLSGIIANMAEVTGESDGQAVVRQFDASGKAVSPTRLRKATPTSRSSPLTPGSIPSTKSLL